VPGLKVKPTFWPGPSTVPASTSCNGAVGAWLAVAQVVPPVPVLTQTVWVPETSSKTTGWLAWTVMVCCGNPELVTLIVFPLDVGLELPDAVDMGEALAPPDVFEVGEEVEPQPASASAQATSKARGKAARARFLFMMEPSSLTAGCSRLSNGALADVSSTHLIRPDTPLQDQCRMCL
jgi:hypothetical protein